MYRLIAISASTGRGPSKSLAAAYPNLVPAATFTYVAPSSLNPWWISGYLTVFG